MICHVRNVLEFNSIKHGIFSFYFITAKPAITQHFPRLAAVHVRDGEMREVARDEAEPAQDQLDGAVPPQAQEGPSGGGVEEEDPAHDQVPAGHHRRHPRRHHGQAQPEARGAQGTARAGHQVRPAAVHKCS